MASAGPLKGQKRKVDFDRPPQTSASRKRQKYHDARAIKSQRAPAAMSTNGELNVASYIKAREFEIKALEKSMLNARKSLSTRAFQQVPRHMRRRTASHNAKKVPRRLRRRAEREMREDNTPTITKRRRTPSRKLRLRLETAKVIKSANRRAKTARQRKRESRTNKQHPDPEERVEIARVPRVKVNKLANPPTATVKFKRRQVDKTWLPTHLWHTKRAHMTRPTEPLWRMALPLSPTEKSYRPSHRASSSAGCVAWDSSYMSTVACRGTDTTLEKLLIALGFSHESMSPSLHKKWKNGSRFAEGWVYEKDNERRPIAPVWIAWCQLEPPQDVPNTAPADNPSLMDVDQPESTETPRRRRVKLNRQIWIRTHPSAFRHFWLELLKAAKMQKPQVLVQDLRFELGSIEVQGPGSTESLLGVLKPAQEALQGSNAGAVLWPALAGLNNPGRLPQNAILALEVVDPRLSHPPKKIKLPPESEMSKLDELLVSWPLDGSPLVSRLLSSKARWLVTSSLPSQKAINRRNALKLPGVELTPAPKDPTIPIIAFASRSDAVAKTGNAQGSWTIILPWACVEVVWRSLMYYPLSSGGTPRFGGLKQKQQLAFEQQTPWFPGDYPGTQAGMAWERTENEKRFDEWIRKPPKHRVAWEQLDLGLRRKGEVGRGWACDWEFLFEGVKEKAAVPNLPASEGVAPHASHASHTSQASQKLLTQRQRKAANAAEEAREKQARRRNTSSPESDSDVDPVNAVEAEVQYTQLAPGVAQALFKSKAPADRSPKPSLAAVRITYLDRGTPNPAARIYRLPGPAIQRHTDQTREPSSNNMQDPSSSLPPPARQQPSTASTAASAGTSDLRSRWLALDPGTAATSLKKQPTNRYGVPTAPSAYPRESLAKINVLPKNATKEIIEKYGPASAFGQGNGEIPKQPRPVAKNNSKGKGKDKQPAHQNAQTASDSNSGNAIVDTDANTNANPLANTVDAADNNPLANKALLEAMLTANPLVDPATWDIHVPCPEAGDLIGFVTSGGYNLSHGRGTAVGSIWAQRVLEGWTTIEDATDQQMEGGGVQRDRRRERERERQRERERHLCIVRNAGEQVGRLAIWELC